MGYDGAVQGQGAARGRLCLVRGVGTRWHALAASRRGGFNPRSSENTCKVLGQSHIPVSVWVSAPRNSAAITEVVQVTT